MDKMGALRKNIACGELRKADVGREVTAGGFVAKCRDLGGLIFADLRDNSGIVQLCFDEDTPREVFEKASGLHSEYVVLAKGVVRERTAKTDKIPTGEVEIYVSELRVLSEAHTPPFEIRDEIRVKDDLRLKYRYLDLRRPAAHESLITRHKLAKAARDYFDAQDFIEIETPVLVKSTPEGARDYLVPSRVQPGHFYALPQSPQLYKQLLMLSGYERYMQIARCFRDEDLRADRQPEFTQIDLEMAFVDEDDVMAVNEGFIKYAFKNILDVDVPTPFRRMKYEEAMERFGSDKPDLRFGLELTDASDLVRECGFGVFSSAVQAGGSVRFINAKGLADKLTRKEIDKLTDTVKTYGAKGLAFTRFTGEGVSSSFEKFLSEEERAALHTLAGAQEGDVLLFVADAKNSVVFAALGALRLEIAKKYSLFDPEEFNFLWVTDFPLFEYSEEEGRYAAMHHPFTMPKEEDIDKLESDPGACHAKAYDMVLNGVELGGGSIRISDPALQQRMFRVLGFTEERMQESFGFLIEAYQYGAPPHGGMAYGFDRLCMLMGRKDSIREVIAFPKVQNAGEIMTGCPDLVEEKQLQELSIALAQETKS